MVNLRTGFIVGIFSIIAMITVAFVPGCTKKEALETVSEPVMLDSVVIENYEGKKLSMLCPSGGREGETAEQVDVEQYALHIIGLVASGQSYTYGEVLKLQHYVKNITLESVFEWVETVTYEGVLVSDVIGAAGPLPEAQEVVFRSQDGLEVSFPLDDVLDKKIMLCFMMDGKPLSPEGGYPFVLASESHVGKNWVKWVTEIELVESGSDVE